MSMQDVRLQAAQDGKTRFFTNIPCKRGHVSERYVSTGACVECLNPKIYRARVSAGDVRRLLRPLTLSVDRRLDAQRVTELTQYLQTCTGQFEEFLAAQGHLNPWCGSCDGKGKHVKPGEVTRCERCQGSGLEPMPVIKL